MTPADIPEFVEETVAEQAILDVHTHIFSPAFGPILLWGIDELLTYHYLVAEALATAPIPYQQFWGMPKREQADYIWDTLFVRNTPVSEARRGVLTCISALGFEPGKTPLAEIRAYFDALSVEEYVDLVFEKANVEAVVMTNDLLDPQEMAVWSKLKDIDERFRATLRIDGILLNWAESGPILAERGYRVQAEPDAKTCDEVRRFLEENADRLKPVYLAASLPPSFRYPDDSVTTRLLDGAVIPFARARGLPIALMIGVKKLTNPALQVGGDTVGKSDVGAVESLCMRHPENKFLITMLARENQHELCVAARKFGNLMLFGCWWFLNLPSTIAEITAERLELLGTRFIPQHSDARVLDQLIYKWAHSRQVIADVLAEKYIDLATTGWPLSEDEIRRDVRLLFKENFEQFVR